jgi:cytochrome c oxidase assembly protein subunit 15
LFWPPKLIHVNLKTLNRLAQVAVCIVFGLIFVGGLVTSWQAGMAVPDWPLSFGSLNPEGWWANFPVRLEHGHRLLAAFVGLFVGVLCASVWGNFRALGFAALTSAIVPVVSRAMGAEPWMMAHLGVWPAAVVFVVALLVGAGQRVSLVGGGERKLALAAFVLVCCQATLGGLRVTRETAGAIGVAEVLRIVHGCVAQAFLMLLVALSVRISMAQTPHSALKNSSVDVPNPLATVWIAVALVYMQLIFGATMRHLGAGLAIPTFPAADPSGSWIPKVHSFYTDLNFTHTRLGAVVVGCVVLWAALKVIRFSGSNFAASRAAIRSGLLVLAQIGLGILVILHQKPRTLATLHVVLGAALLASVTAMAVRLMPTREFKKESAP